MPKKDKRLIKKNKKMCGLENILHFPVIREIITFWNIFIIIYTIYVCSDDDTLELF